MDIDVKYNLKFSHCLYKYVSVKTLPNKQVHEGWLKTIDPISGNLLLVTFTEDSSKMDHIVLIARNTYDDVKVLKEIDPKIKSVLLNLYAGDTSHLALDAIARKELVVAWLKRNRLPIRETENGRFLVVCESVTIYPPYNALSCNGPNGRVLMMISNLISKLPIETPQSTTAKGDTAEKNDVQVRPRFNMSFNSRTKAKLLLMIYVLLWGLQKVFDQRIPDDWLTTEVAQRHSDLHYFTYSGTCPLRNMVPVLDATLFMSAELERYASCMKYTIPFFYSLLRWKVENFQSSSSFSSMAA